MSTEPSSLDGFSGVARLFPLPNLVLFPHVLQPLHIFEPRYRQMTAEALAGDRYLAPVLLRPGWEGDYDGSPLVHGVACLGQIVAEQGLEDGRFNILLRGLARIRIDHEVPHGKAYRQARVEILEDIELPITKTERRLRRRLLRSVPPWLPGQKAVLVQFRKLLRSELPLGTLCDIVAFALPLDVAFKQQLLEETDVETRARALLDHLDAGRPSPPAAERKFPPEFSVN